MNQEVRLLFRELAELSPGEREQVFQERQIGPELRAEVESLLGFDSTSHQYLTDRVSKAAADLLRSASASELGYCGQYRLIRLLGSGGMGAVYLAERTDGEIQQQVAVKLLGAHVHRPVWRDRFLKERQLLASLHHPSIVHVIDAGHTDEGRPYLVMEYVEGQPLDEYAGGLQLRDRLRLFLRVCEGVSHAHHHLIIHRDLKPSNILVDASGQPKLLDFGIAKLLDETGDQTQTVERLLTPNYASPEQLRGTVQTTATDIYSLGAVLYKLLTGRSPHESETAAHPDLPVDLDYILRKALRDEPEERYASVETFAADIRAFLESRPVQARSGNVWYRTRKFLRRYWVPVAAAGLVIASLSAGLYVANRERVFAQRRFGQLRQLSNKIFDLDRAIRSLPGSTEARQSLVTASLDYLEGLRSDVHGDLDLAQEVAAAYARVARVQGVPVELNLGQLDKAEESLKKADALNEAVLAARPQSRSGLISSATIAHDRMIVAASEGRRADALLHAHKAVDRMDALMRLGDATPEELDTIAGYYGNVALVYKNMRFYEDSLLQARKVLDIARSLHAGKNRRISVGLSALADAQRAQGDLDGALQATQQARQIAEETETGETDRMMTMYAILLRQGAILGEDGGLSLGRSADALGPLQKAFDLTEAAAEKSPKDFNSRGRLVVAAQYLGNILRYRDPMRALKVYDLGIRRITETPNSLNARRQRALLLADSSYALLSLQRTSDAKQRIDTAFAILRDTKDYPAQQITLDNEAYTVLTASANYQIETGDPARGAGTYEELLQRTMASKPDPLANLSDANRLGRIYYGLAGAYRRTGDTANAQALMAQRLDLWQHWDRKLPNNPFVRRQLEAARLP